MRLDRREFTLVVAGMLAGCWSPHAEPGLEALLDRTTRDQAARIGRQWLGAQSAPPNAERLLELALGPEPAREVGAQLSQLATRVRSDFADGRVHEVEGWQLAQSEVALYALTALFTS